MTDAIVTIPLYDPVIMGNPLYIWLIIGLFAILMIFLAVFKLEVYDKLIPVWGYRDAATWNIPLAIVRGMSGKIKLLPVKEIAGIFSAMGLPLKWIQTTRTQGQLGIVNTIEVSDDWNIVEDVDLDYAITKAAHDWNELWGKTHKEGDDGFIYDFESFDAHLANGDLDELFPSGIRLPPVRFVDLHEIRRYRPKWTASNMAGYIIAELEKRKPEVDETGKALMTYALIAGGIILICAVLAYLILSLPK